MMLLIVLLNTNIFEYMWNIYKYSFFIPKIFYVLMEQSKWIFKHYITN